MNEQKNRILKNLSPEKGVHLLCSLLLVLSTFADQIFTLDTQEGQLIQTTTLHPKRFLKFDCSTQIFRGSNVLDGITVQEVKIKFGDKQDSLVFSQYESWTGLSHNPFLSKIYVQLYPKTKLLNQSNSIIANKV